MVRQIGIHLYWIPLGAGGVGYIRLNGRIYEAIKARVDRRRPLDLYHSAVEVSTPDGRYVVENAWPSPDSDTASRGVILEGPVLSRRMGRIRPLRYEIRCWKDGVIPDASEAIDSPQLVSRDVNVARHLMAQVAQVPPLTWGRDEARTGEMWNSNSVVSWLLARSGVPTESLHAPSGGRAPGWQAGVAVANGR